MTRRDNVEHVSVLAHFRVRYVPPGLRSLRSSMYSERCYLQPRSTVELAANSESAEHAVKERDVPLQCGANSSFLAAGASSGHKSFWSGQQISVKGAREMLSFSIRAARHADCCTEL